jgi:hypothetical protein
MLGSETKENMVHLGDNYNVVKALEIDAPPIDT